METIFLSREAVDTVLSVKGKQAKNQFHPLKQRYTPNGLEVNFFQKRRQESEERLCVRSLDQQSRSGKIGYEKTDIKQT